MTDKKDQKPIDTSETDEDLKSVAEQATRILIKEFESFGEDLHNFEKNHEEKRKKLFDGNRKLRKRTGRRAI